LEQTISQGGFAVVYMCDDAKIPDILHCTLSLNFQVGKGKRFMRFVRDYVTGFCLVLSLSKGQIRCKCFSLLQAFRKKIHAVADVSSHQQNKYKTYFLSSLSLCIFLYSLAILKARGTVAISMNAAIIYFDQDFKKDMGL
jgi:hypothetical protein